MTTLSRSAVTQLLQAWSDGDRMAQDQLWPIVWRSFRRANRRSLERFAFDCHSRLELRARVAAGGNERKKQDVK